MSEQEPSCIVIGGGPEGLTAACEITWWGAITGFGYGALIGWAVARIYSRRPPTLARTEA